MEPLTASSLPLISVSGMTGTAYVIRIDEHRGAVHLDAVDAQQPVV